MPAPENTSTATAIDISSLPFSHDQRVDFEGTTYTVYYKRSALAGETGYGFWGLGDLTTYQPSTTVVDVNGTAIDFGEGATILGGPNKPIQHAVSPGTTYYYKVVPNGGNPSPANLTVAVQLAPHTAASVGDFFINEDSGTYPAVVYGTTANNLVKQLRWPFPGGEHSAVFSDGTGLYNDDGGPAGDPATVQLWSGLLTLTNANVMAGTSVTGITCNGTYFYVGENNAGTKTVKRLTKAGGTITTVASALVSIPNAIAVSPDSTTLYFVKNAGSSSPGSYAIGTWNLGTNLAGADFVAAVAGKDTCMQEILCLSNGKVVVAYANQGSPFAVTVKVYNTDGSTAASYSVTNAGSTDQRLATTPDDPTSFVIYCSDPADAQHRYVKKLTTLTGAVVWSVQTTIFNKGVSTETSALTGMIRFGHASSCPVTVLRQALVIGTGTFDPIRVQRRFLLPSETNLQMFLSRLELFCQSGVGLSTGQGSDPQVFLRVSKDGGQTWTPELWTSMGAIGDYSHRSYWNRLGRGRNFVCEVTCSDPVFIGWLDAYATLEDGTS